MDESIKDILKRASVLLGNPANKDTPVAERHLYTQPVRRHIYFSFLSDKPNGEIYDPSYWDHWFITDPSYYWVSDFESVVFHGHPSNVPCAATHFCHEYGYWLKMTDNPIFVKNFNMIWKETYDKLAFKPGESDEK